MKTKYPSMFGVLAALLLVASFIIPADLANPSTVEAGVCGGTGSICRLEYGQGRCITRLGGKQDSREQ